MEDPTFCIIRLLSSKRLPPLILQGKGGSGLIIKGDDRSGGNWCLVCYVDSQYSTFIPYLSVSLRCVSAVYVTIFCSGDPFLIVRVVLEAGVVASSGRVMLLRSADKAR